MAKQDRRISMQGPLTQSMAKQKHDADGTVLITDYHRNRAVSTAFAIVDDVVERSPRMGGQPIAYGEAVRLLRTDDLVRMAELFATDAQPAGGWYLVREQREWLLEELVRCLDEHDPRCPVRVLEAGLASFVHHYTYVEILRRAVAKTGYRHRINLIAVDLCAYPIHQVEQIESMHASGEVVGESLVVDDIRIPVDPEMRSILARLASDRDWLSVRPIVAPLETQRLTALDEPFDLITEHFLTAVITERMKILGPIRSMQSEMLRLGGRLLCATGIWEMHEMYFKMQRHMASVNLDLDEEHLTFTWDPYSLERELVTGFADLGHAVSLTLDNAMASYVRTAR